VGRTHVSERLNRGQDRRRRTCYQKDDESDEKRQQTSGYHPTPALTGSALRFPTLFGLNELQLGVSGATARHGCPFGRSRDREITGFKDLSTLGDRG
jgi:hypothetical protein